MLTRRKITSRRRKTHAIERDGAIMIAMEPSCLFYGKGLDERLLKI